MKTPLINIQVSSIYKQGGQSVFLPTRLARCTPDMYRAIKGIAEELQQYKGSLVLSDLFRSYDMQYQANLDYKSGKKKAYSPPPGGSLHEAGRSMDIDLSKIKISLGDFWKIARKYGVFPIISEPKSNLSEAWHFDCRGSHGIVYDYYRSGKANNMPAYTAMAISSILAVGIPVDKFAGKNNEVFIQSGLIRLGYEIGNMDGNIGARTKASLQTAGIQSTSVEEMVKGLEDMLQAKFPEEYWTVMEEHWDEKRPEHLVV